MLAKDELSNIEAEMESRPLLDEELETQGWRIFSDYDDVDPLEIFEQESDEGRIVYAESEIFENILGYTLEELLDPLNEKYSLELDLEEFDSYEYGNGWVIFKYKE